MKVNALVLATLVIAIPIAFFLGRASSAPDSENTASRAPIDTLPVEYTQLVERFEALSEMPLSKMSLDEKKFFTGAMDEYQAECMYLMNSANRSFCTRFAAAIEANNRANNLNRVRGLIASN